MKRRVSRSTLVKEMDWFFILIPLYIGFGILPLFERTVYKRTASKMPERTLTLRDIPLYTDIRMKNK
jgi:hypothetical protein